MNKRLFKILVLILSILTVACFSLACAPDKEGDEPTGHVHSYPETYTYNEEFHWYECECGEKKSTTPHSFVDDKCVCGYEKKAEGGSNPTNPDNPSNPDTPTHTHEYSLKKYDNSNHWLECSCGVRNSVEQHELVDGKCACGYEDKSLIHTHVFDRKTINDDYLKSVANCTEKAVYYYSCKCGEKGSETFENGSSLGHSFTNYFSDNNATYESDGTKTAACDGGCGKTDKIKDVNSKKPSSFAFCNVFTVNKNEAYMKVNNETTNIHLSDYIEIVGIVNYSIYKDSGLTEKIGNNLLIDNYGINTFYVVVNVNDVDITYIVNIYRRSIFTVSFNTNFGSSIASQKIEEDNFAIKPNNPTKQGYTFSGWDFDFNNPITKDFTITALWKNESYTCYLNSNDGYFENRNVIVNFYVCDSLYLSQSLENGQTLNCPVPKHPNPGIWKYNFAGWYKDSNFVEKFDFDEKINQDLNLYARFLRYVESAAGDSSNEYLSTNLQYFGSFSGFNLICNYTGTVKGNMQHGGNLPYSSSKMLKITNQNGDVLFEGTSIKIGYTYKIEYEFEVKKYDVISFNCGECFFSLGYYWTTNVEPSTTVVHPTNISIGVLYDKPTNFPVPKKEGMKFVGWFDIEGNEYTNTEWKTLSNLTLYAKWEAI